MFIQDDQSNLVPAGQVTPDANGNFCAVLRRGLVYYLREEEVNCFGRVAPRHARLEVTNPDAFGACGTGAPNCEDVGDVRFVCDFLSGS